MNRNILAICVYVIFLFCSISCRKRKEIEEFYQDINELRDKAFNTGHLLWSTEKSLVTCGVLCTRTRLCQVTGWNPLSQYCMLYNTEPKIDGSEKTELGWLYHRNSTNTCTRCPTAMGYDCDDEGICFKYYNAKNTFLLAQQICIDDGGNFMRIDSPEKQTYVSSIISGPDYTDVWIQGRNADTVWRYDDGTPFSYTNWNTGEGKDPPAPPGPPALYPILRKSQGYKWHDSNGLLTNVGTLCEIV